MQLEVNPKFSSWFSVGQKVWFVKNNGREYNSGIIASILFIYNGDRSGGLRCERYYIEDFDKEETFEAGGLKIPVPFIEVFVDNVYELEEMVKILTEFHPVVGISEEEWLKAIGNYDDEGSIDKCDLPPCCASISQVRDILMDCKKEGGLVESRVRFLEYVLENSHGDYLEREVRNTKSFIGNIYRQLGIKR